MKRNAFSAGAVFSGIGGFCLGFLNKEIETKWAIECDEYAGSTYRHNIASARLIEHSGKLADLRNVTVSGDRLEPVDVLHAGFPCQSFSQAGNRKGFRDERGKLFFELMRLVNEFGEERPKIIVLENSPYLRYGEGGQWLYRVMSELRAAGYWFRDSNCAELDLYDFSDSPQQRKRLFMVALSTKHFKNGRFVFPEITHECEKDLSMFISFAESVSEEYYLPEQNRYHEMILKKAKDRRQIYQLRKYTVRAKDKNICPTLTANMGQGGHNVPFIFDKRGLRKLTENECLRLQGFPDSFHFPENVPRFARYMQVGNSVSPKVAEVLGEAVRKKLEELQFHE